jgi:hypothetical protein
MRQAARRAANVNASLTGCCIRSKIGADGVLAVYANTNFHPHRDAVDQADYR